MLIKIRAVINTISLTRSKVKTKTVIAMTYSGIRVETFGCARRPPTTRYARGIKAAQTTKVSNKKTLLLPAEKYPNASTHEKLMMTTKMGTKSKISAGRANNK